MAEIIIIKNDKGDHDECCACGDCPVEDYICDCSVCGKRLYDDDEIACDGDSGGCCPRCAPEDHRCNCYGYNGECCVCERFFYDDEDIVVNSHGNKMCRKCDEECEWEVNCENCKKVCGKEECPFDSGYGGEPFICDECHVMTEENMDTTVLVCRRCGNLGYYMDIRDDRGADKPDYKFGTCGECDPPTL
jgi:hypothetical protein